MATTLLVPGFDGGGEGHWLSWFEAAIPNTQRVVPADLGSKDLSEWAAAVRWHIDRCESGVFIVAHGFGCLAAVRAGCDLPQSVDGALLVAPCDPDNLRLAWLLPEEPLGFPATIVASSNDPGMRLSKAAFWAGFWSCDFVNAGSAGSIDPRSGFGTWPEGLAMLDEAWRSSAAHPRGLGGKEAAHLSRAI